LLLIPVSFEPERAIRSDLRHSNATIQQFQLHGAFTPDHLVLILIHRLHGSPAAKLGYKYHTQLRSVLRGSARLVSV
jgi:hypothetical protein